MTILPKKRNPTTSSKENEKSDPPSASTSHNHPSASRHTRQSLLIQDPTGPEQSPVASSSRTRQIRDRASKRRAREQIECSAAKAPKTSKGKASPSYKDSDDDDDDDRCNSADEYEPLQISNEEWENRDREFNDLMRKKGFVVKSMVEDGACLFRAIADQVYGNEDMHTVVRHNCMDYILQNRDFFSHYITEDIMKYVSRKRKEHVHGNHLEVQAVSEMYNRTIEVYCYSEEPINIFHGPDYKHDTEPIRLSYQRGSHYNSIQDPYRATVGIGLGLPNYKPGEADRKLLNEAQKASELNLIEQTMIEDKIAATDWEATNDAILEQATRESWAIYVNDSHNPQLPGCSNTGPSSSTTDTSQRRPQPTRSFPPATIRNRGRLTPPLRLIPNRACASLPTSPHSSPRNWSPRISSLDTSKSAPNSPHNSPKQAIPSTSSKPDDLMEVLEENVCMQMPPEIFGLNSWDDDAAMMAQVLAESQKEYLESLRVPREDGEQAGPSFA